MVKASLNATEVTLSMSIDTALHLRRLLGHHIVGPNEGPRQHFDSIWDALAELFNDVPAELNAPLPVEYPEPGSKNHGKVLYIRNEE